MVKSLSGHVHKDRVGLVWGKPRKKRENTYYRYNRENQSNRKAAPREHAAIIMLRRKGYTYNQLATAFQRSTSYIYKTCRTAMNRGILAYRNYKVIPYITKMLTCNGRLGTLLMRFQTWIGFIEGSEDKPP